MRIGPRVLVAGTTATAPDGTIVGLGDAYRQAAQTLDNIERALTALGSAREHVVRLRVYVVDFVDFDAIARALSERYASIRPALSMVKVAGLVDPAMRVEIEAESVDPAGEPGPSPSD